MNTSINWDGLSTKEAAFAGGMLGTLMVAMAVFCIFLIIAYWRIFTKAGIKGWKALIPIYNIYCAYKMVGISPLWILWQVISTCLFVGVTSAALGSRAGDFWASENPQLPEDVASNVWVIITMLLTLVINLYVGIRFCIRLAKAFKKGTGFTIGLILLPEIFTLILGFGAAKYD
ncbi:hypothetical protein IJ090_02250, partial [Candidatus Saccharibacteria bacterium]|nr:hypothetical protein [Candidatus Saccharibacteria bacterium]